eukprot:1374521-Rhodomonas_salina.1
MIATRTIKKKESVGGARISRTELTTAEKALTAVLNQETRKQETCKTVTPAMVHHDVHWHVVIVLRRPGEWLRAREAEFNQMLRLPPSRRGHGDHTARPFSLNFRVTGPEFKLSRPGPTRLTRTGTPQTVSVSLGRRQPEFKFKFLSQARARLQGGQWQWQSGWRGGRGSQRRRQPARQSRSAGSPPPRPRWPPKYTPKSNTRNRVFSAICTRSVVSCVERDQAHSVT